MTKITKENIRDLIVETRADLRDISNGLKKTYDRRRALDCKLVERSKSYKGYCKYIVTISEKDGTIHKQPAYGKDMQDALSRLINKERTVKIEKKMESNTGIIFLLWLVVMATPAIITDTTSPWFLAYVFGSLLLMMVVAAWWYNYIKKGE